MPSYGDVGRAIAREVDDYIGYNPVAKVAWNYAKKGLRRAYDERKHEFTDSAGNYDAGWSNFKSQVKSGKTWIKPQWLGLGNDEFTPPNTRRIRGGSNESQASIKAGYDALDNYVDRRNRAITDRVNNTVSKKSRNEMANALSYQNDQKTVYRGKKISRSAKRSYRKAISTSLKTAALHQFVRYYQGVCSCGAGSQSVLTVPIANTYYGNAGSYNDLSAIAVYMSEITDANNIVPIKKTGNAAVPVQYTGGFYVRRVITQLDVSNNGATACVMELYLCASRMSMWSEQTTAPDNLIVPTPIVEGIAGSAMANSAAEYFTLFDSRDFCKNYKILKMDKYYLQAGQAMDLTKVSKGCYFDPQVLEDNINVPMYKGNTLFWVIVGSGAVAHNSGSPNFSASQLDITSTRKYDVKMISQDVPRTVNVL